MKSGLVLFLAPPTIPRIDFAWFLDTIVEMSHYTEVPSLKKPLSDQVDQIKENLLQQNLSEILAVLLVGSVAKGKATYRSDIDLLFILRKPAIKADDSHQIFERFSKNLSDNSPLPVQIVVVGDSVFQTQEPAMKQNLKESIVLADPRGTVHTLIKSVS